MSDAEKSRSLRSCSSWSLRPVMSWNWPSQNRGRPASSRMKGQVRDRPHDRAVRGQEALLRLPDVDLGLEDAPRRVEVRLAVVGGVSSWSRRPSSSSSRRPSIRQSSSFTRTYWPSVLNSAMPIGAREGLVQVDARGLDQPPAAHLSQDAQELATARR
jgi:hypothetical protein